MKFKNVLNCGFVELVDVMGDDYRVLQAARVSTGGQASKSEKEDKGLIRYLYKNEHLSPFEQITLTFHVKAPLFVMRQWMRHRTFSYNEYSARYSKMINEYYVPDSFHKQSEKNHQGRTQEELDYDKYYEDYTDSIEDSFVSYSDFLDDGMAKEQARCVLPLAQYTEVYMTVNLRNLFHFLELRLDSHAQYEIRVYAEAILEILESLGNLKWSIGVFKEFNELKTLLHEAINVAGRNTDSLKNWLRKYIQTA